MTLEIIKKIPYLDFRIYKGGLWNQADPMRRYNLFFGWNGGGKTSFSRALSCLTGGNSYDDFGKMQIEIGDKKYVYDKEHGLSLRYLHVFNEDYVSNVSQMSTDGLDTVLYLHENGKKYFKRISELKEEKRNIEFLINNLDGGVGSDDTKLIDFFNDVSSEINKIVNGRAVVFDADVVAGLFDSVGFDSVEYDDFKVSLKIFEEGYSAKVPVIKYVGCDIAMVFAMSQDLISVYTDGCEDIFSDDYDMHMSYMRSYIDSVVDRVLAVAKAVASVPYILPWVKSDFDDCVDDLRLCCTSYLEYLAYISDELAKKDKDYRYYEDVEFYYIENIDDKIDIVNTILLDHNLECSYQYSVFYNAAWIVAKYIVRANYDKYKILSDSSLDISAKIEEFKYHLEDVNNEISKIFVNIDSSADFANYMTENLSRYIGRNELTFELSGAGYVVKRNNEIARWLSEGERVAIAFVYFLSCVTGDSLGVERSIVVVDDPVSSLDSGALHSCFSYMSAKLCNVSQLIVLTHNYAFFNMVKRWFKGINKTAMRNGGDSVVSFYTMSRLKYFEDKYRTVIKNSDSLLLDYESEYMYLFSYVYKCANSECSEKCKIGCYPLMNIARRLLETYLGFKYPTKTNLLDMVNATRCTEEEKKWLYALTNDWSHGHPLDRGGYDFSILVVTQRVSRSVLSIISQDTIHYAEMIDACS